MNISLLLAVALGGALGAVLRYGMSAAMMAEPLGSFSFGIVAVNIIGSFAMGVFVAGFALGWDVSAAMKLFVTVGVLGGFTTFSAFSFEAVTLIERGQMGLAGGYIALSVCLSIVALMGGLYVTRLIMGAL